MHNLNIGRVPEMIEDIKTSGIEEMIPMDYAGFATVYSDKRIVVDAGVTFGETVGDDVIISLISPHLDEIARLEKGCYYAQTLKETKYNLILTPIRRRSRYSSFFFICKKEGAFTKKDIRTVEFITNITIERLELNYTILREKNFLENIHESIPTQILTLDTRCKIVSANRVLEEIIGDRRNYIGKTMRCFLSEETQYQDIMKMYQSVLETRTTVEGVKRLVFKDGKIMTVEIVITPFIIDDNELIGAVFYGTDITEKKIYEREIEQLRQYALLGEFSAYIAHDIKNPLSGIRGITRVMQKDECSRQEQIEFLEEIITSVDRINKTVEQLLSYARLSSDHQANMANINQTLDNCIDAISFHGQLKQLQIFRDYDRSLPLINAKQFRLEQAFMNILLNSVQAIESEGYITISTKYLPEEGCVKICIADNGVGFDNEDLKRVQEPFYTTKADGTGLGLSIVHRAVEEHGGDLEIESVRGKGTMVAMTLFCDGR